MTRDCLHLEAEIAKQLSHLLLLYVQERSDLRLSTLIRLVRVEDNDTVHLSTDELSLFFLILDILRHQDGVLYHDTALFRSTILQLSDSTLHHIFLLNGLTIDIRAKVRTVRIYLRIDHLVIYLHLVERKLVVLAQLDVDLRSQSQVETELEILAVVEIQRLLHRLVRHRLTQYMQVVLTNILKQVLRDQLVHDLYQSLLTKHFLNHAQGHHTFTETRHICFLANATQILIQLLSVVRLHYFQFQDTANGIVVLIKRNVHYE